MKFQELLINYPELSESLTLKVDMADLKDFAEFCFERGKQEKIEPKMSEEYLTPAQMAETLKVSLVTLWSWDKKSITKPLRIGNAKRYRRSDLEKILKSR